MEITSVLAALVLLQFPPDSATHRVEALGSGVCRGGSLVLDYSIDLRSSNQWVGQLRASRSSNLGFDSGVQDSMVLWTTLPDVAPVVDVEGRIGFLALEKDGWIAAASPLGSSSSPSLKIWDGPQDMSQPSQNGGAKSHLSTVGYVQLLNVHLDGSAEGLISGDLYSPLPFFWNGKLVLIGTTSSIGYDPRHDWGPNRPIWMVELKDRASISEACKSGILPANQIASGEFPSILCQEKTVTLCYWDGPGRYAIDRAFPVRFLRSADLANWYEPKEIPSSLPVFSRFVVIDADGFPVVVSRDYKNGSEFHVQTIEGGAWHDKLVLVNGADDSHPEIPFVSKITGNHQIEIVWATTLRQVRCFVVHY